MKFLFFLTLSFLLVASSTFASEVTHTGITLRYILVSQDGEPPYQVQDYLCVVQHGEEVACGFVEKIEEKGALVDLEFRSEDIAVRSLVRRAITRRPCDPNFVFRPLQDPRTEKPLVDPYSRRCTDPEKEKAGQFKVPISRFFSIGMGIASPRLAGETAFSDSFSAGLSVDLQSFYSSLPSFTATASGTAYGGSVFLGYYPVAIFEKLFIQFSVGYYQGRLILRNDLNNWSGTMMGFRAGYRFLNWQGFGVGLSLSAQHYSFKNAEDPTPTQFLYPGALIEFGGGF